MKRYIYASLLAALILFPLFAYIYVKGCEEGVLRYKHSNPFLLSLTSAYVMGVRDGWRACKENT
jgi:hypothetical protein